MLFRSKGVHNIPLDDASQAMRIVRENAEKWQLDRDKVGIMGFSAGGHLASTLATHYDTQTRPSFQILVYPVITFNESFAHKGSRNNLIGAESSQELIDLYSNELQVTTDTPPAFITLASDDRTVPPSNSAEYYMALCRNKFPASLFSYPTGGHGYGFRDGKYRSLWLMELEAWLSNL